MIGTSSSSPETRLALWSSTADVAWSDSILPHSHVRWHFDALSDDGREALFIVFSSQLMRSTATIEQLAPGHDVGGDRSRSVIFAYFRDGRAVCRAQHVMSNEVDIGNVLRLSGSTSEPSFSRESAPYGSGYSVELDVDLSNGGHLNANLEWLSVESNLAPEPEHSLAGDIWWNIAAPRADVSGRIEVRGRGNALPTVYHFRGTGYHDQRSADADFLASASEWLWCRAHFADTTAIFFRFSRASTQGCLPVNRLALVRGNEMEAFDSEFSVESRQRFRKGHSSVNISAVNGTSLLIVPKRMVRCGEVLNRYVAELTVKKNGCGRHTTNGLVEILPTPSWHARLGHFIRKTKLPWQ